MIIDCILDRRDNELYEEYNAKAFYNDMMMYRADSITRAMDGGTEEDVKKALCEYIDRNEYNPRIKKFINRVNWLTDEE